MGKYIAFTTNREAYTIIKERIFGNQPQYFVASFLASQHLYCSFLLQHNLHFIHLMNNLQQKQNRH